MDKRQRIEDAFEKALSFGQRTERLLSNALAMLFDDAGVPYEYRKHFSYSLTYKAEDIEIYYIWKPADHVRYHNLIGLTAEEIYRAFGVTEEELRKRVEEGKRYILTRNNHGHD